MENNALSVNQDRISEMAQYKADTACENTVVDQYKKINAAQPASRLRYSSDGLLYVTPDHYEFFIPVGTWK